MKREEGCAKSDIYGRLCRDRAPIATAELRGNGGNSTVRGSVDFYATPAGILVSARVTDLPRRGDVFVFCLEEWSVGRPFSFVRLDGRRKMCLELPPLCEKEGEAWCSVITKKLTPMDLSEKRISIRERSDSVRCARGEGREIAGGFVSFAENRRVIYGS